ncbi:serine hydrolase [Streptomyces antioxidans]|uniref:serine hydrolase n=1 Tax=Streptomyces TaxID=1883 RepID=UPI003B830A8F
MGGRGNPRQRPEGSPSTRREAGRMGRSPVRWWDGRERFLIAQATAEPNRRVTTIHASGTRRRGRSWAEEVNARIIRSQGLRDTSTPGTFPSIKGPHARGYAAFGTDTSTTHDLNRFYTALLGGRLLAPAQLDEMTTTRPAPELGVRYGLGLGEIPLPCGGSYFGHPGELLGYHLWSGGRLKDRSTTFLRLWVSVSRARRRPPVSRTAYGHGLAARRRRCGRLPWSCCGRVC